MFSLTSNDIATLNPAGRIFMDTVAKENLVSWFLALLGFEQEDGNCENLSEVDMLAVSCISFIVFVVGFQY